MQNCFVGIFCLAFIFVSNPFSTFASQLPFSTLGTQDLNSGGFPNLLKGTHFFVHEGKASDQDENYLLLDKKSQNCREQIKQAVCLVGTTRKGQAPIDRKCLAGSKQYAVYFERLYDNYPAVLQKAFCSLRRIFVEKEFEGTAYAGAIIDGNKKTNGAMIGIRQSVLDENLDLQLWATWKEQLSFGGAKDSYTIRRDLPMIETRSQTKANDFLYFVIAHEFAHILDFANNINAVTNCTDKELECDLHKGSWGAISWQNTAKPKPKNEFVHRPQLCFYWCNGKPVPKNQIPSVYAEWSKTEFISLYATRQPWDDFADSLAYFLMAQYINTTYRIETSHGASYDIVQKLNSSLFQRKLRYLKRFLRRSDIVYP